MFNAVEDCLNEVVSALAEAGTFEPVLDIRLAQAISKFSDAADEDGFSFRYVP